jgi:putative transcriptional regulator
MTEARTQTGYLGGKLLIASPLMGDSRFDRTVVYVCSHGDDQAMGLVVNQPMDGLRLPDLLDQLDIAEAEDAPDGPVLNGGPVSGDRGFVLHTLDVHLGPATLEVSDRLGLTATKEILEALASDSPPERFLMMLGYAGWEAGQLEDEIGANAWLVCECDEALVFDEDAATKWSAALKTLGVTPEFLTASSGHA